MQNKVYDKMQDKTRPGAYQSIELHKKKTLRAQGAVRSGKAHLLQHLKPFEAKHSH